MGAKKKKNHGHMDKDKALKADLKRVEKEIAKGKKGGKFDERMIEMLKAYKFSASDIKCIEVCYTQRT